jgi:hypothetical protein
LPRQQWLRQRATVLGYTYTARINLSPFCTRTAIPPLFLHLSALPVAPPLVTFNSLCPPKAHKQTQLLYSPSSNSLYGWDYTLPPMFLKLFLTCPGVDPTRPFYPITLWQEFELQQPDWLPRSSQEPLIAHTDPYAPSQLRFQHSVKSA